VSAAAIPWAEIVTLARGVVTLAIEIARVIEASGCTVEGCPHDVRSHLNTAPIPAEDERMLDARGKAFARVRGLDRAGIEARRSDADNVSAPVGLSQRASSLIARARADADELPGRRDEDDGA
jgi:hypothetical protein